MVQVICLFDGEEAYLIYASSHWYHNIYNCFNYICCARTTDHLTDFSVE